MKKLKKFKLPVVIIIFSLFSLVGCSQAENAATDVAKEILYAYKNKDVELLKKNASGIIKQTISPSYFEDKSVQDDTKAVDEWDGTIKEVRYDTGNIMGNKVVFATAYYADAGPDQIYAVVLSSLDNGKNWVFMGNGLGKLTKEEFKQLSKTIPVEGAKKESKTVTTFSAELANGDTFDNISEEKMVECINSLDDDNFFIILKNKEDFIQAAFSDGDFVVQYKEDGKQFSAEKVLTKEETIQLFKDYYQGKDNWKTEIVWVDF
ncbi:MAG: hypothetical protein QM293_04185 [Bacteroidota bacterium]|jgi:hypothetical protein|nr:hypothetical protein [Bacteroidota bacterium]HHU96371.1 hypothetical protein [Petrimonas sp.]